jgi:RNA polymerase sigma factor (sigma-70 family)
MPQGICDRMDELPSIQLLDRVRDGDEQAAAVIFARYVQRLTSLARARLSKKLSRRVDPEDVVQSAYRSFFRGARDGRFSLREAGHLWSLLAKMTLRKVYRQVARHTAAKQDIAREQSVSESDWNYVERAAQEPSPVEVNAVAEVLAAVMAGLAPLQRQMLELYLQGTAIPAIAEATDRSTKTVRRLLDKIQHDLETQLKQPVQPIAEP